MMHIIYGLLANKLTSIYAGHIHVGLYLAGMLNQSGEDHVRVPAGIYIEFPSAIPWMTLPGSVQRAVFEFTIHSMTETTHGDSKDITELDHYQKESLVHQTLMNMRFMLSEHPDFTELADTDEDRVMIESIVRVAQRPHVRLSNLIITQQVFQCTIFDYSASPVWTKILATLNCNMEYEQQ